MHHHTWRTRFKKKKLLNLFYVYECSACVYVHHLPSAKEQRKGVRYPRTGVTDGCEMVELLGIGPKSSGRAASAVNDGTFSPAPLPVCLSVYLFLKMVVVEQDAPNWVGLLCSGDHWSGNSLLLRIFQDQRG
jgi:hypothetical protein